VSSSIISHSNIEDIISTPIPNISCTNTISISVLVKSKYSVDLLKLRIRMVKIDGKEAYKNKYLDSSLVILDSMTMACICNITSTKYLTCSSFVST
jgi:hypothetical protein